MAMNRKSNREIEDIIVSFRAEWKATNGNIADRDLDIWKAAEVIRGKRMKRGTWDIYPFSIA